MHSILPIKPKTALKPILYLPIIIHNKNSKWVVLFSTWSDQLSTNLKGSLLLSFVSSKPCELTGLSGDSQKAVVATSSLLLNFLSGATFLRFVINPCVLFWGKLSAAISKMGGELHRHLHINRLLLIEFFSRFF